MISNFYIIMLIIFFYLKVDKAVVNFDFYV